MKFNRLLSANLLAAIGLAGCAGDGQTTPSQSSRTDFPKSVSNIDDGKPSAITQNQMPTIPAGAQYTIFCASDESPNHSRNIQNLKSVLQTNMKSMHDWYVVTGDSQSTLYYGFYKAVDPQRDKAEGERARRDKQAIQALTNNATQDRLFQYCAYMALEQKDPGGPPEWNLANAKGYWSLQIAAFKDIPNRKEEAIEAVRQARLMGIEAYYFHGDTVSSVCIGAWPETAIRKQEADVIKSNKGEDQTKPLMVIDGSVHLTEQQQRQLGNVRDSEGNQVKVMQPKLEILDKDMLQKMQAYPTHDVNNQHREAPAVDKFGRALKDAEGHDIKVPVDRSFLVIIPHKQPSFVQQQNPYQPQVPALEDAMLNPNGSAPQGGRLRSITGGH